MPKFDVDEPWWEWIDRRERRRVVIDYLMDFSGVVYGLVAATLSICDPKANADWGFFGWVFAIVSAVRLLSIRRRRVRPDVEPAPVVWRIAAALVAVFCMTFLATMIAVLINTAGKFNELGVPGIFVGAVLTVVGLASGGGAIAMALK